MHFSIGFSGPPRRREGGVPAEVELVRGERRAAEPFEGHGIS